MSDNNDALLSIVTRHMQNLRVELQSALSLDSTRLQYGTWKNERGMFAVYISFFPHGNPAEDSIDAVVSLDVRQQTLHFKADISRSNGDLVAEISEHDIFITPLDESFVQLEKVTDSATREFKKHFVSLLSAKAP